MFTFAPIALYDGRCHQSECGILVVLAGHVVGLLIPRTVIAWNSRPVRLYVLEITALVFGVPTMVGLAALIGRRATNGRLRTVTSIARLRGWHILVIPNPYLWRKPQVVRWQGPAPQPAPRL